jgi:HEPN domain-containing protein
MKPEKILEVKAWLKKAADDLRGAEIDLAATPPLIEDALFHCQQACEKSLKGFLTCHDRIFRKTHDLDLLANACLEIDASLTRELDEARDLTVFAWEFRYPGEVEVPPEVEVRSYLTLARQVFNSIRRRLPEEVRPE